MGDLKLLKELAIIITFSIMGGVLLFYIGYLALRAWVNSKDFTQADLESLRCQRPCLYSKSYICNHCVPVKPPRNLPSGTKAVFTDPYRSPVLREVGVVEGSVGSRRVALGGSKVLG
ncbi:hypothetical protein RUND412_002393 [Rhizina undulata]